MTAPLFPTLAPQPTRGELLTGLGLPLRALRLIFTNRALFAWSAVCGLVSAATLVAIAWWWWPVAQHWGEVLVGSGSTWRDVGAVAVGVVLYVLCAGLSALTVPNLVLAPLADPLSEATETRCGDFESPPFSVRGMLRGTAMSLRHTVLRLLLLAGGLLVLAPLHFIPVAGSVLWLLTSWGWSAFWLAVEHVSTPAARHLSPLSQVVKALRARPALALGLGASLWALLWVPLVNVFLLPVAVVAGTLAFRSLQAAGAFTR